MHMLCKLCVTIYGLEGKLSGLKRKEGETLGLLKLKLHHNLSVSVAAFSNLSITS